MRSITDGWQKGSMLIDLLELGREILAVTEPQLEQDDMANPGRFVLPAQYRFEVAVLTFELGLSFKVRGTFGQVKRGVRHPNGPQSTAM